ncbi:acyltransferase [Citrobacter freundii]|uniref:acyltransferase family protein n=1 Tax=Citrobacter TaxID=544 RepID=UPI001BCE3A1E|nr:MULTISPECIES: acyltransferase family protein [Citrobacter]MBJ8798464.1 acyltransferase [Citrobacter freundii]MDM2886786.1 acyltransferase [Citrobacter sp. Cpo045]MDM2917430.1 acyltransferase [Citrobacter sp. Cpo035]MDV1611316.1 acyltransferase family protein [Citrobacter portucalensis]MEB0545456.1 acyltransferase family protein [Citrobacter portucalensis]
MAFDSFRPASPSPKAFRHDINGLRAWAVLAVVFYHFGVPGFSGGFIGVDVFFVISGFLMTAIIVNGLERGNFSLWSFYLARARRIIPALIVLCSTLLFLGWFWLPTADYHVLALNAITALTFVSNLKFWREAGYFDITSRENWLLHTWSLSVEWQFYILLPVGCILLWRWFGLQGVKFALIAAGVLSLALSIYVSPRLPGSAFYLLPTRIWELLAGGAVWWLTRRHSMSQRPARILELVGFILIALSVTLLDVTRPWPGSYAVVPVLGTVLVLAANRQRSFFTSTAIFRQIGASSYSIYLWHWPLAVLLSYADKQHNPWWIATGIVMSLLLGKTSLLLVEIPTRKQLALTPARKQSWVLLLLILSTGGLAAGARYQQVDGRINPAIELAMIPKLDYAVRFEKCLLAPGKGSESPMCRYGKGELTAIVLGDSHASMLVSAVAEAAPGAVVEMTYASCPTVLGMKRRDDINDDCKLFNDRAINLLNNEYKNKLVFIANRSSLAILGQNEKDDFFNIPMGFFDTPNEHPNQNLTQQFSQQLVKTLCSIENSQRVFLVRPIPEMAVDVPNTMARALMFGKSDSTVSISLDKYYQRQTAIWAAQDEAALHCGVNILNPLPYLCKDGRCWGDAGGRPLYSDSNHLSAFGSRLLLPMFQRAFKQAEHTEATNALQL